MSGERIFNALNLAVATNTNLIETQFNCTYPFVNMNEHSPISSNQNSTSTELRNGGEIHSANEYEVNQEDDAGADAISSTHVTNVDGDTTSQMTEINIDTTSNDNQLFVQNNNLLAAAAHHRLWTNEERDTYQERRRQTLSIELRQVQRKHFFQFVILCVVPMTMIGLTILFHSFHDNTDMCEEYGNGSVICERERRTFLNYFGSKCFCNAFEVEGKRWGFQ